MPTPKVSILDRIRGLRILCICCSTSTLPQDTSIDKYVQEKTDSIIIKTSEIKN